REPVIGDVHLLPVIAVVGAPVRAVLRADIDRARLVGVRGDRADGRRLGQAARRELPAVIANSHAIEAGFHGTAWSGSPGKPDVPMGRSRHGALLRPYPRSTLPSASTRSAHTPTPMPRNSAAAFSGPPRASRPSPARRYRLPRPK